MAAEVKTSVFEIRCDIRTIATLAKFMLDRGNDIRSKSELSRICLETFLGTLRKNGLLDKDFQSTVEAKQFLETLGMGKNKENRGDRTLMNQIKVEADTGISPRVGVKGENTEDIIKRVLHGLK